MILLHNSTPIYHDFRGILAGKCMVCRKRCKIVNIVDMHTILITNVQKGLELRVRKDFRVLASKNKKIFATTFAGECRVKLLSLKKGLQINA